MSSKQARTIEQKKRWAAGFTQSVLLDNMNSCKRSKHLVPLSRVMFESKHLLIANELKI